MSDEKARSRLESALLYWEDLCFLLQLSVRMSIARGLRPRQPFEGPIRNSKDFRTALLSCRDGVDFDLEKFCGPTKLINTLTPSLYYFPAVLWSWSYASRRIYRLNAELQDMLQRTTLEGLRWSDVRWPFKSLAIQLASPIAWGEDRFDFVLIADQGPILREIAGKDTRFFQFLTFSEKLDRYVALADKERSDLLLLLTRKRWTNLWDALSKRLKSHAEMHGVRRINLLMEAVGDLPFTHDVAEQAYLSWVTWSGTKEDIKKPGPEEGAFWGETLRASIGFLMYLTTLPSSGSHVSDWRPGETKQDPLSIMQESQVCEVFGVYTTVQEGGVEGPERPASRYEVRPHDREGHWRKRPGQGNDPTAAKTVWVRPARVREDRRMLGTLPIGTTKVIP